ncbi:methyltransferase domain-containing protein [Streptomyces sp. DT2A-34]|uniref:class I SAM-dependent methyltransferase n=1 Tax=Streptomyces sp. DT2A-34 TaxID=3051182 RepID=UPI00265C3E15|nr:class I SAM-dependent methyltransferase [Streptomyces sp. DT2A-34]MDO0917336.1 methyltransferase domain-containing protein [Streptomyces sp. DT2A-34]
MNTPLKLAHAYETDNNPLLSVLHSLGWGSLLNLGYFTPLTLPRLTGGLSSFQEDLVSRSLALLRIQPGEQVLDVACGTGRTTRRIAEQGAFATGIDLYPPHVAQAVQRHGDHGRTRFLQADATDLRAHSSFGDAEFDKVHCLEAAFHFGPEGRRAFLEEAYRLLKPGGRLVLVDFAWATGDPTEINAADPGRVVRDTWAFEEFEPLVRYIRHAIDIGYRPCRVHDWTRPVTRRFMTLGLLGARLALTPAGRRLLGRLLPPLKDLTHAQWLSLSSVVLAHVPVQRASRYVALVLDKPVRGT